MKILKSISLFAIAITTLTACSDDDAPMQINEEEVITTMTVALTASGEDTVTLTSRDTDGDGPNEPTITVSGAFAANTTYSGSIVLLNETESPAEDITEEVREEAEEHQFFYQVGGDVNITTAYVDMDANDNPVGIDFTLTTGAASSGSFTVILRHALMKDAEGVSQGNIANAGGETDISQTFQVSIQ